MLLIRDALPNIKRKEWKLCMQVSKNPILQGRKGLYRIGKLCIM